MQFTKRDAQIIDFAARHKFVTAQQIADYTDMNLKTAYRRLKKLVAAKYLYHERYFLQEPGIYYPSRKGLDVAGCSIGPLRSVPLSVYHHDLQLVDLALMFYRQGYQVKTERELKAEVNKGIGQVGKQDRLPDLVIMKAGETVAIELEIAKKSPDRHKKIINYYARQRHYSQVWFFCRLESIKKRLEDLSDKVDHIKVFKY